MATWNSRGLRGSTLEEMINSTNEIYQKKGLALIQKIPTPFLSYQISRLIIFYYVKVILYHNNYQIIAFLFFSVNGSLFYPFPLFLINLSVSEANNERMPYRPDEFDILFLFLKIRNFFFLPVLPYHKK